MEWWVPLLFIVGIFLLLLAVGLPVFLAFTVVDVLGIYFLWGGSAGLSPAHSFHFFSSISSFVLLPVPLFVLMGELLVSIRASSCRALDTLDKWMGRLPGRSVYPQRGGWDPLFDPERFQHGHLRHARFPASPRDGKEGVSQDHGHRELHERGPGHDYPPQRFGRDHGKSDGSLHRQTAHDPVWFRVFSWRPCT